VLPLPRRRVDPEVVRDRLRALAAGRAGRPGAQRRAALGFAAGEQQPGEPDEEDDEAPRAAVRTSLWPAVVAVLATALAAWGVVHLTSGGTPSSLELVAGTPVPSVSGVLPGPPSTASPAVPDGVVVVQVVGQVRHPGLVTLTRGSRVADAVAAAGGLVRGGSTGGLNLARVLTDGEQVLVSPGAVAAPGPVSSGVGAAPAVVDLNSATVTDLDTLPGVGPVMAARILDWRSAHGRYTSVEQLREVSGIGARTFERLKPHVRV
jgi:competence protein ComEA